VWFWIGSHDEYDKLIGRKPANTRMQPTRDTTFCEEVRTRTRLMRHAGRVASERRPQNLPTG
jgi:hypothetical protein